MKGQEDSQSGLVINVLIDDLKNEDVRKRLNSVNNLREIALKLGPERTRLQLIPFLNELMDDQDEILLALADSLSQFIDVLGGPQYASILIPPMETLCRAQESSIREKVIDCMIQLIGMMDKKNEDILLQLIKRLFESEYYMSQNAAAAIIPSVFKLTNGTNQTELFGIFTQIAQDEIPIVRQFASISFKDYIALYPAITEDQIVTNFNSFLKDEQDFVRIYLVTSLIALTKTPIISKNPTFFQSCVQALFQDQSWRIKYFLCEKLNELVKGLSKDLFKQFIYSYYLSYLSDQEPELRAIASSKIDVVSSLLDADEITKTIIPLIQTLSSDTQSFVRKSLAGSFLAISSLIGQKPTTDLILPIFLHLLQDQDSDVRINLFIKLGDITKVLGVDTLSQSIMPALTELANDKNWRIKVSSIEALGFFAKEIGAEFLNEKIIKLLMDWLNDKVYAVREAAMNSVQVLIQTLGSAWAEKNIMPQILSFQNVPNYLHRMTILFLLSLVGQILNADYLNQSMLPVVVSLSKDPVSNVRMNVGKSLRTIGSSFKDKDTIKKILVTLCEDTDDDVKYQAKLALDGL